MEADTAAKLLERIICVVASETGVAVEEIKPSTTLVSMVTDSLEMLNLMMELEGEFGLVLENDDLQKIFTVQDVAKYIETHPVEMT